VGRIKGRQNETAFAWLLNNNGILNITRTDEDCSDLGRKWRAALSQLGFIVPEVKTSEDLKLEGLGAAFTLTVNGWRLLEATTVPGMQECFLRSLAAYCVPSVLEQDYDFPVFSPLRHTLSIMLELEHQTRESRLNFLEMGLIVQLSTSISEAAEVASKVLEFRSNRDKAENKRRFDRDALNLAAEENDYVPGTFSDYADLNFRYLKATGLVQSKGRGLSFVPEKHLFIERLVEEAGVPKSDRSYLVNLCNGAVLPTDNKDSALAVLQDLVVELNRRGIPFDLQRRKLDDPGDITIVRHEIEELIAQNKEEEYYLQQANEWQEIITYMSLLITRRRSMTLPNEEMIKVPQSEAPAYFEWVLWRAFLAINSLTNKPYEARRFKIDQDFLPIGTAPGNGPDMIFEFESFVLVVEVTLTDNSRQEAAEGETVRRHVADLVLQHQAISGKPVYGLFIANRIDSNTAETFRFGVWYTRDDVRMRLDVIPVTLPQFRTLFEALFQSGSRNISFIRDFLVQCGTLRNHEAPIWKMEIDRTLSLYVDQLLQQT